MKYADLHCDTLTECLDKGYSLADCNLQTNLEKLNKSGCAVQCFAIFTQGENAALRFEEYLGFYLRSLKRCKVKAVLNCSDLEYCINSGETGAILTVENLGFVKELSQIQSLAEAGVKMASLVWNYENALACPNLLFENGAPCFSKRNPSGLKPMGKEAVELLDKHKIIIDISHLSDGGADDILKNRKAPLVASHSNSAFVNGVCRNLTDGQIKKIAACGGVIGVNFCKDFLGEGDTFNLVLKHINRIINVGGEDVIAFGSDFDGIPAPPNLEGCEKMPALIDYLNDNGISGRVLEKLCYKNFVRVFKEVIG